MREKIGKLINKWTVGILTVMLVAMAFVVSAKAETLTYGPLTYTVSAQGEITITDCDESASGELVIPEEIDGYPVVKIGYGAFSQRDGITSLQMPSSVQVLEAYAFYGCEGLQDIYINDLKAWCNISCSNPNFHPMYYADNLYLSGELLSGDITIPKGTTNVSSAAFYGCDEITSVTIPEGVTKIGMSAFAECGKLETIIIPEGVTSIESGVFKNCSGLLSVKIPSGVPKIALDTFRGCSSLTSIEIPTSVTSIGDYAFHTCSSLKNVEIPKSVTSIGNNVFLGCSSLIKLEIPEGVNSIGKAAFYRCNNLTSIEIPASVTSIGESAFYECSSLASVTIPEGVTSIGSSAFDNCKNLVLYVKSSYAKQYAIDNNLSYIAVPNGIQVTTLPNKTNYCLNETFVSEGIAIHLVSFDGIVEDVTHNAQLSGFDSSKAGIYTIKVTYNDYETTFDVTVHDKHQYDNDTDVICNYCEYERTVDKIEIHTMPTKTEYCLDKTLDLSGLSIKVTYSDATSKVITEGFQTTGFDSSKAGVCDVVISYEGKSVSYKVTVNEKHTYSNDEDMSCGVCEYIRAIENIAIQTMPTKITYKQDESLDLSGLSLKVSYSDGTTKEVTEGYEVSGFSSVNAGECKVVVSYKNKTTSFDVTIEKYVATEFYLDKTELTEKKGKEIQLTATCTPALPSAEKVVWSSSDESVATVDQDGNVTTLSGGVVTITASVGGKQATCTITILEGEWVKDSKGYWYKQYDGSYPHSEWKIIDGNKYYFDASGYRATGWASIGGKWYYFNTNGLLVKNQWIGVYYTDENGKMVTNSWVDNGRYYVDASGAYVATSGWFQLNGKYYYLSGGLKQTGWVSSGGVWYYMDTKTGIMLANEWLDDTYYFHGSGAMATGWTLIGGKYYYFEGSGAKVTNRWIGNYYLKADGVMATNEVINGYHVGADGATINGWKLADGKYYYYVGGLLKKGWLSSGGVWYYMDAKTGAMYASEWLDDTYYFKASGAMATGWTLIGGKYYYFEGSGAKVKNRWIGNYYMKADGVMATSEWVDNGKYYVDANGVYVSTSGWFQSNGEYYYLVNGARKTGWFSSGGVWYYLDTKTGVMYADEWLDDTYYFNASGAMVTGWKTIDGNDYYFNGSGAKEVSQWIGDYYVDSEGKKIVGYPKSVVIGTCPQLNVGDTHELSVTLVPSSADVKYVTWTSSDESVATIENGVIKANSPGIAKITASVNGMSSTCSVRVKEISVTKVSLDITSKQITAGETFTLHATVTPSNATYADVTWTSSDEDIATVENGVVTGKAQGTVTITAKAGSRSASCTVLVSEAPRGMGETWTVADKWRFTITGIETHTKCNPFDDEVGEQVIIIHYKYYNDGYIGIDSQPGLYFGMANFNVYDENGQKGTTYACTHEQRASQAAIGTYCEASIAYIIPAKSDSIRIDMTHIRGAESLKNFAATYIIEMPYIKFTYPTGLQAIEPLHVGDVLQTKVDTNYPNDVKWSSIDTRVATVDSNGKITAVGPGTATVKASVGGAEAIYVVFVNALQVELLTPMNTTTNQVQLRVTNMTDYEVNIAGYGAKVVDDVDSYLLYNINGKNDGTVTIEANSTVIITLKVATYHPSNIRFTLGESSSVRFYYTWRNQGEYLAGITTSGIHTEVQPLS